MLLVLNYDISETPWWTPPYVDRVSVATIGENISTMRERICAPLDTSDTETEHELIFEGYSQFHKIIYVRETLIGEGSIPTGSTVADVEKLLSMPIDDTESGSRDTISESGGHLSVRMAKKVQNLRDAVNFLFPTQFDTDLPAPEEFTPDLLMAIHRYVGGHGLISYAGSYRTKWLAPAKEDYVYLDPVRVPIELPRLCASVRAALCNDSSLLKRVALAAAFATNFLHIHPFSNGNGRVARLAVSWLLQGHTVVPVPLYANGADQEVFLECVQESRIGGPPFTARALSRFVLESVERVHRNVLNCLF
ncbi:fido domain-containing protein [Blyttiomyces helicus]|uniref:Fido domain-containing protein n=1 Tax=Blyttiomyces helicus TaxID=388810 RepID=A0A4P9W450_9FUNG|nr:fido domain-containing protein [Blyttiomyces helicus]|eukprot:RKO87119.1 fido domain-containing protein [Blyttiomyces helicus]